MSDKKISYTLQQYENVPVPKNVLDNVLYGDVKNNESILKNITDELEKSLSKIGNNEVKLTKK